MLMSNIKEKKVPVTILIPVKNEAAKPSPLFIAVSWADEIFVVDFHSTDDSVNIAQSMGAQFSNLILRGFDPKEKTGR